mgnify:CR=1 FL=1|tara:strand:+ start:1135 stop:1305 length:171 start_codon:yes stop_codon:yes gene_type:complete
MANEWFYIESALKKDEQVRNLRRDLVFSDDGGFTVPDDVPIVSVNDDGDDLSEEEK